MLLSFLSDLCVHAGRTLLFIVQTYMGRPLNVHSVNGTRMYGEMLGVRYFLELPFG
jgi:hypothetical protein